MNHISTILTLKLAWYKHTTLLYKSLSKLVSKSHLREGGVVRMLPYKMSMHKSSELA